MPMSFSFSFSIKLFCSVRGRLSHCRNWERFLIKIFEYLFNVSSFARWGFNGDIENHWRDKSLIWWEETVYDIVLNFPNVTEFDYFFFSINYFVLSSYFMVRHSVVFMNKTSHMVWTEPLLSFSTHTIDEWALFPRQQKSMTSKGNEVTMIETEKNKLNREKHSRTERGKNCHVMSDMKVLRSSMAWMMLRFDCCLAASSLFASWKDSNSFILFSFHITHEKLLNNRKIEIFSLLFWLPWKFFSLQSCRAELPGIVVTLKESKSRFYRFHDCGTVETMRKYNSSSISWKNFQHTNTLAQKVGPFAANNEAAQKKFTPKLMLPERFQPYTKFSVVFFYFSFLFDILIFQVV